MESMYDYPDMLDFVEQYLEIVGYPFRGYRCKFCGYEVKMKKSMGNAKGAMIAHLKGDFNKLNPNPPQVKVIGIRQSRGNNA